MLVFLLLVLGVSCILPVCFGLVFRCPFILIYRFFCAFTYQKKKKKNNLRFSPSVFGVD